MAADSSLRVEFGPKEDVVRRIVTPCPACGRSTLFIGSGGHLTCSSVLGCQQPSVEDAVVALKAQAVTREKVATLADFLAKGVDIVTHDTGLLLTPAARIEFATHVLRAARDVAAQLGGRA